MQVGNDASSDVSKDEDKVIESEEEKEDEADELRALSARQVRGSRSSGCSEL